jgi:hypothetical protein
MADKLDEVTLVITDDHNNWFAACPFTLIILMLWLIRELWRKLFKRQNIFKEVNDIERSRNG